MRMRWVEEEASRSVGLCGRAVRSASIVAAASKCRRTTATARMMATRAIARRADASAAWATATSPATAAPATARAMRTARRTTTAGWQRGQRLLRLSRLCARRGRGRLRRQRRRGAQRARGRLGAGRHTLGRGPGRQRRRQLRYGDGTDDGSKGHDSGSDLQEDCANDRVERMGEYSFAGIGSEDAAAHTALLEWLMGRRRHWVSMHART